MALIISAVLAIIGINWLRVQPLQLLFGLSFIILASSLLGKQVETRHALSLPGYGRFVLGFLYFVIIFIVAGSAFFYLWQLGNFQISLIVVLILIMTRILNKTSPMLPSPAELSGVERLHSSEISQSEISPPGRNGKVKKRFSDKIKNNNFSIGLSIIYLALIALAFKLLLINTTADSIRSPWEVVPVGFFVVYFFAALTLLYIINFSFPSPREKRLMARVINFLQRGRMGLSSSAAKKISSPVPSRQTPKQKNFLPFILTSIFLFLSFSVSLSVYQVGFGFDPFVHEAGQKIIYETGSLSPKPLRYLGYYSLVVSLAKILGTSFELLNKLIVPLIGAIILPSFIYESLKKFIFNTKIEPSPKSPLLTKAEFSLLQLSPLLLLVLPFAFLTFSVPFSLSLFFLLLASLDLLKNKGLKRLILFALAALLIHPLGGLPALILVGWRYTIGKYDLARARLLSAGIIYLIFVLFFLTVIPASFLLLDDSSGLFQTGLNHESIITQLGLKLADWVRFFSPYHFVYLFQKNLPLIISLLLATLIVYAYKNNKLKQILPHLATSLALLGSFLISSFIDFSSLITYEQPEFILRFITIITVILLPLIIAGAAQLVQKTADLKGGQLAVYFFVPLLVTSSLYLAYPRVDAFVKSRAFSTSAADFKAVEWIENDAAGQDYVVLANQAVSAAALKQFGFKKYYPNTQCQESNDILGQTQDDPDKSRGVKCQMLFYYPLPTSSPLYNIYLGMVYQSPTRKTVEKAMAMTSVNLAYFVINDYWLDFEKIVEAAKLESDEWVAIDGGKIYIYKYKK